jgi:hypothetical protein
MAVHKVKGGNADALEKLQEGAVKCDDCADENACDSALEYDSYFGMPDFERLMIVVYDRIPPPMRLVYCFFGLLAIGTMGLHGSFGHDIFKESYPTSRR